MKEQTKQIMNKWPKSILVTFLGAAAIEIFIVLYGTLLGNKDVSQFVPWTFHALWEIAALAGIAYAVKKCDIELETYCIVLMLGLWLIAIIGIFVPDSIKGNQGIRDGLHYIHKSK